jgi:error-prone DNA polymerase
MPELPPPKRLPHQSSGSLDQPPSVAYAELHCRTNFSFLEGASHADELVVRAAELGYRALAITDRNSLAGVVRAHEAATKVQPRFKLLIGAEVTPVDAPPVLLWATDRAAYARLSRLLTVGRRAAPKGECYLKFDDVAAHASGLLAGVLFSREPPASANPPLPPLRKGGTIMAPTLRKEGATMPPPLTKGGPGGVGSQLNDYRDVFGDRCYLVAELHRGPEDRRLLQHMMQSACAARVSLVAANDAHYHVPQRRPLQDVLTAIRHGCSVAELGERLFPNGERYLKSPAAMQALFADCPQAVERTLEVAERCTFTLDELRYEYPEELTPPGLTPLEYLTRLTWEGAHERYPQGVPDKVRRLIEHELALIADLRYEAYFLTVWDLVKFARGQGILCQGRGSAANSAVCFCLGVTSVDPERIDVLFERFVSRERNEAPDIDVDFEHERREEVVQYVYRKYGRERSGMTAEVITYQVRSAVRDVGKALGLSLDRVDVLAKVMDHHHDGAKLAERMREAGFPPDSHIGRWLVGLVQQLVGFPRHLSQHVGGLVITQHPLCELVPIENAAMSDRTVVEWDKDDLDTLGILKVDCLALGMLTAIRKCFDLVDGPIYRFAPASALAGGSRLNEPLTLANVPAEDPAVYEMMSRADTIGVFQIESRAQMSMLPRLRPSCFYDLVIEVALVRPGPIQGGMVHPYLRRRRGEEPIDYPDERIRSVLEKTLGVPIFQEQAMRLAVVAAGFTLGEADQLRRAMGAWRRSGVMEQFRQKLIGGMLANGYSADFAERLFRQIQGFGEYGFPESHAASFALLVYVSAWLKLYYPAAFTAALLNSQPMGFYAPAQLVADARKHGVEVRGVDVNCSDWDCTLESVVGDQWPVTSATNMEPAAGDTSNPDPLVTGHRPPATVLRLGLRTIRGLAQADGQAIMQSRRPFVSFTDFVKQTRFGSGALKKLARADAFRSLHLDRRTALWQALPQGERLPLFDHVDTDEPPPPLPEMAPFQEVLADYKWLGMTLRRHPISFLRPFLDDLQVAPAAKLPEMPIDCRLKVAGIVVMRQRPSTAKGITFVTLEDETGMVNLIVHQEVWERYRRAARTATVMLAHGRLERQGQIIHVLVSKLEDLTDRLRELSVSSRDFR